jgi:phage internal scaffolding protein
MSKLEVDQLGFAFNTKTGEVLVSPIRTLYMPTLDVGVDCSVEPSLTRQDDLAGCDINVIMAPYERVSLADMAVDLAPSVFVDLASAPDFRQAADMIAHANEAFAALPASLRKRFSNDPSDFLAFMEDPSNTDESIRLGLRVLREDPVVSPSEVPDAS